jgi:hypothetical protein
VDAALLRESVTLAATPFVPSMDVAILEVLVSRSERRWLVLKG